MDQEVIDKLNRRIVFICDKFKELGFEIDEDMHDLINQREDIAVLILNNKLKKINFFKDENLNSVGFNLGDVQVTFFIEDGEDHLGPYYETTAEIIKV